MSEGQSLLGLAGIAQLSDTCREGNSGVSVLETAYQYNHQSGTLHLPLRRGGSSPVAIKVGHVSVTLCFS